MNKSKMTQHRNLMTQHPATSWKSGGGYPGNFRNIKQAKAKGGRRKVRHVGQWKHLTREKRLPFGHLRMKEWMAEAENSEGHSGDVWLQARTSGNKNGEKRTTGRPSTWIRGWRLGHEEQNKKKKSFPRCLKSERFHCLLKIFKVKNCWKNV